MKKIFASIVLLLAGLLFVATAEAKVYTVRAGDTLSKIARAELGDWKKYRQIQRFINGQNIPIVNPNVICIGWQLWIPEKQTVPFLPPQIGKKGGKEKSIDAGIRVIATELKKEGGNEVIAPSEKISVPKTYSAKDMKDMLALAQTKKSADPVKPVEPPKKEKRTELKVRNLFEAIDSANLSYSRYGSYPGENKEREGWDIGAKLEWRPLKITNIGEGSIRMGLYGRFNYGESEVTRESDGRFSEHDYTNKGGGLSFQYKTKYDEWDLNLGVLWHESDGRTPAKKFWSNQKDKLLDVGLNYKNELRRLQNKEWFPEWSLGIRYQHPFDTEYRDSKGLVGEQYAYDEKTLQFGGNLWIRDFYLTEDRNWYLTPGFNVYIGKSWGKDSGFIKFGPMVRLTAYEQEIVELSFLNPKKYFEDDGSRIYWFALTLRVDDIVRAIYASQVEDYEPDDEGAYREKRKISREEAGEKSDLRGMETLEQGVYTSNWGGMNPTS